jgi:hypothetical protein
MQRSNLFQLLIFIIWLWASVSWFLFARQSIELSASPGNSDWAFCLPASGKRCWSLRRANHPASRHSGDDYRGDRASALKVQLIFEMYSTEA